MGAIASEDPSMVVSVPDFWNDCAEVYGTVALMVMRAVEVSVEKEFLSKAKPLYTFFKSTVCSALLMLLGSLSCPSRWWPVMARWYEVMIDPLNPCRSGTITILFV